MSNEIINLILIVNILITGLTATFPEDNEPKDFESNEDLDLRKLLKNYMEKNRAYRRTSEDSSDDWHGRWMPERPSDPKPPPKIPHKSEIENSTDDWHGRWMPERPTDPKPPRKIFHKSDLENVSEDWHGRWMPERFSDPKPPPKIFHKSEIENPSEDWHGRWMPERPSDPKPPPKISHKSEDWSGRWMPERPTDPKPPQKIFHKSEIEKVERIPMGIKTEYCDDGKTNLSIDWDHSPVNHTCYGPKITPEYSINPHIYCEYISPEYVAMHKCMHEPIEYDDPIPLFGSHRPIWPVYGEYKFVPRQRWIHNAEHGAVVMLYHPCANPLEVKRLKALVTGCMWRHIISPSNLLSMERPLALVTWGCRLTMSYVDPELVEQFIMEKALRGPERVSNDGDFEDGLLKKAKIVSDAVDSKLCPNSKVPRNQIHKTDNGGKLM
ncbi:uncharacterized protein LOC117174252 [Belonocnema kinseyi]|uniref:uncharacterized protein LOC117174252 n=1 Tax=Belonocnema kinseyi TaxID=2817044 RepID=UPI00143DDFF5|nr:uncharacterized protein LOC117174252 [Belonocnema kinseyi]